MSGAGVSIAVIVAIVVIAAIVGFYAGARHRMDLEQWTVAGRGFGTVMVWLLMAGEVYTTFSLLGASGWSYDKGGPTLYIVAYITLAYVVSFYILPGIWEAGRRHGLQTESDYFEHRYGSKYLGAFVAVVAIVFIVPYLQLQLTGLGIIVEIASFGVIGRTTAMVIAFGVVVAFVLASGVRAVAWVSVMKDFLLLFTAVFVGIAVPHRYFGGVGPMFAALAAKMPAHLTMPGSTGNLGHRWFISSVLLSSLGFYMWPHAFAATFTARDSDTLRRNAVAMPLYTITLPLIFFVGFSATLVVPGLKNGDLSFLTLVRQTFPAWFLGVIGGAGALTAMVPSAILVLSAAALFARNIYRPLIAPDAGDRDVAAVARVLVIVLAVFALYFAVYRASALVSLLLLGYGGVTQFFPGVVLGLYWNRTRTAAVCAGIVVGLCALAFLVLTQRNPFFGLDAGFCALFLNFAATVAVSLPAKEAPGA